MATILPCTDTGKGFPHFPGLPMQVVGVPAFGVNVRTLASQPREKRITLLIKNVFKKVTLAEMKGGGLLNLHFL